MHLTVSPSDGHQIGTSFSPTRLRSARLDLTRLSVLAKLPETDQIAIICFFLYLFLCLILYSVAELSTLVTACVMPCNYRIKYDTIVRINHKV